MAVASFSDSAGTILRKYPVKRTDFSQVNLTNFKKNVIFKVSYLFHTFCSRTVSSLWIVFKFTVKGKKKISVFAVVFVVFTPITYRIWSRGSVGPISVESSDIQNATPFADHLLQCVSNNIQGIMWLKATSGYSRYTTDHFTSLFGRGQQRKVHACRHTVLLVKPLFLATFP